MDKKTEESIKNYNKIASNYDETFDGKFTRGFKKELANIIHLEDGYKLLDVACGNGMLLKMLSNKKNIESYGVDISENMVKEAQNRYPQMQFCATNSAYLPFEDRFFDIITVCAAFHHFTEPLKFISEAKRILKPGGYIYVADPYFPPIVRQITNIILPLLKMGDVKVYAKAELLRMFQDEGFKNMSVKRFGMLGCMLRGVKS
jgi:ubiquinone/menaquinone biosynthesis C-methylase UbiE